MKPPPIRLLVVNTHVGDSLRLGGFKRVRRRKKPHVVMLQEVQRPTARARARALHNPLFWVEVGLEPKSDGRGASGTLIFAKRSRFKKIKGGSTNRLITAAIEGDPWHPERRLTRILLRDRKTGRYWRISNVHTWTLGRPGNNGPYIREEHMAQVDAHVYQLIRAKEKKQAGVAAGDWNELIGDGGSYVERRMGDAGARDARMRDLDKSLALDEAFVTDDVEVEAYERIPAEELDSDHRGLYVEVAA